MCFRLLYLRRFVFTGGENGRRFTFASLPDKPLELVASPVGAAGNAPRGFGRGGAQGVGTGEITISGWSQGLIAVTKTSIPPGVRRLNEVS